MNVPKNDHCVHSRRLSLQVERYHTWPKIRGQSDGEHTCQLMRIYVALFGVPRAEVWNAILEHDMPEIRVGDIPFNGDWSPDFREAKKAAEERAQEKMGLTAHADVTTEEQAKIKLCDLMDCFEWGHHELRMGNTFGGTVADNVEAMLTTMARAMGVADKVIHHMHTVIQHP